MQSTATRRVGERAGAFRIGPLIGEGPNGAVYAARGDGDPRELVLKVVQAARCASDASLEVMRVHSERLHRVDSRFVPVLATGWLPDGVPFFVAPRVEGQSWARTIDKRGWLVLDDVLDRLREAAPALDRARERGLVHGHLHPGNVFDTPDGGLAFTDAGLGAVIAGQSFAPERHDDVRALAATAFELLTGLPPYRRSVPFDRRHVLTIREATGLSFDDEIEKALARAMLAPPFETGYDQATDLVRAVEAAGREAMSRPAARRIGPAATTTRPRRGRRSSAHPVR